MKKISLQDMWNIVVQPTQAAHLCKNTYYLGLKINLGGLVCIANLNSLVVRTAERHWNQVKQVKS